MPRFLLALLGLSPVAAQADVGMAKPWQLGFQAPATPVMEELAWLHDDVLMWIISGITVFVLVLMIYIALKFNRKANPVPSKTTHNVKLEMIWTILPVLILVGIAIPSIRVHNFMEKSGEQEMTLKVTGFQWYWGYEYPDNGGIAFESRMLEGNDLKEGDVRLLSVDNNVVVPVNTRVRVQLTGADVIHSWAIPAFGIKRDAVPGRLNETWFEATKEGRYHGQCSELCGVKHGFMPIVVDVVSKEKFAEWVKSKQAPAATPAASAAPKAAVKKPAAETPAPTAAPEAETN